METKIYSGFKIITLLLFIIFITLFFASYTGYYDYENKKQAELTSEQIKKSTEYYNQTAQKKGRLSSKASMVQQYNERNEKKK